MDTLIISAILGTTDAGIYAAGTRYLLIGLFTAEAIMQVIGPRISALLALRKRNDAARLYSIGAAWQTAITWSVYLIVLFFSTPLLRIFGPDTSRPGRARVAGVRDAHLVALRPLGHDHPDEWPQPVEPLQRLVAVGVNLLGNFLLVPHFGITAAGATWAVTIVIAAALPAYQARRDLGVHPWSGAVRAAMLCASVGVGLPVVVSWLVLGPTAAGITAAIVARSDSWSPCDNSVPKYISIP